MNAYDTGTLVRLTATFTVNGVDTDPTTVTGSVRAPDGTSTPLTVAKDSVGVYHADFTASVAGLHWYRFAGTGTVVAAEEKTFYVEASNV